jgi:D-sedoheptulose 7-phosphate isomerase
MQANLDVTRELQDSAAVLAQVANNPALAGRISHAVVICLEALRRGNKLLFAGNGGSAADCQHMAGEYVSRFNFDRPGLAALALTVDTSAITAIGNDYGYERLFARQLEALGRPGDVLFAYSTSGNSPNIVLALERARQLQVTTIGMTGNRRGKIVDLCDVCIEVASKQTPRIQEGHLVIGHAICALVERGMFDQSRNN